jgi:hypothetical protein
VKPEKTVAGLVGAFFVVAGLWALFFAHDFYTRFAGFPPYNEHFIHDIGSFMAGVGMSLLLANVWGDALLVVLVAAGVGQLAHAASHWLDLDLAGTKGQAWLFSVTATVLLVAAAIRYRRLKRRPTGPAA